MSTVLVHNSAFPTEADARAARPTTAAVRNECWWNVWQARLPPFRVLTDGMPVLLLHSWRGGGGTLTWLVHAREVHTESFPDKAAAVRAIARWAGQPRSWVSNNPYTLGRPANAGVAIYWQATPIRRIDAQRPSQLALLQNGWCVTDDADLKSWGIHLTGIGGAAGVTATARRRGGRSQGRRLDVETKTAIERRALTVAKSWCRKRRWTAINDVSSTQSWDLEATDTAGRTRFIEVKGTTGGPDTVEVTKGEVDWARRHGNDHAILIVHGIAVTATTGRPVATGGVLAAYDPWKPRNSELVAQRFTWQPSKARVATS